MSNQDAMKQFEWWEHSGFSKSETPNTEALFLMKSALGKQIPMKTGNCGVCGNCETFGVKTGNKYCYNCGQAVEVE